MGRFDDYVAVVTGGSSGIGLVAAKRLHQEGAHVAIAGRDEQRLRNAATCRASATISSVTTPTLGGNSTAPSI